MTANLVIVSVSEIGVKLPKLAFHQHQKNIPADAKTTSKNQYASSSRQILPRAIALLKQQRYRVVQYLIIEFNVFHWL
ncbi:MAG: hypothetical protein V7K21_20015 [Nostoc sp.]|uniref:hypothetical protein n=1 Tax=Nostoc sp. TaxID=1180 RepID=UPI002FFA988C